MFVPVECFANGDWVELNCGWDVVGKFYLAEGFESLAVDFDGTKDGSELSVTELKSGEGLGLFESVEIDRV